MRVVITGSRKWTDVELLERTLDALRKEHGYLEIAHGASRGGGVDLFASQWAAKTETVEWPFPVRSGKNGIDGNHRGAPLNRNIRMLKGFMPDRVIAFRSAGKSNGTDHCIREANKLGIPVTIIPEDATVLPHVND